MHVRQHDADLHLNQGPGLRYKFRADGFGKVELLTFYRGEGLENFTWFSKSHKEGEELNADIEN